MKLYAILLLVFVSATAYSDELIKVYQSEWDALVAQIDADEKEIDRLSKKTVDLIFENAKLSARVAELEKAIEYQRGFFLGGALGYQLMGFSFIEYRFDNWAPMVFAGYESEFFFGGGASFRVGKWK